MTHTCGLQPSHHDGSNDYRGQICLRQYDWVHSSTCSNDLSVPQAATSNCSRLCSDDDLLWCSFTATHHPLHLFLPLIPTPSLSLPPAASSPAASSTDSTNTIHATNASTHGKQTLNFGLLLVALLLLSSFSDTSSLFSYHYLLSPFCPRLFVPCFFFSSHSCCSATVLIIYLFIIVNSKWSQRAPVSPALFLFWFISNPKRSTDF